MCALCGASCLERGSLGSAEGVKRAQVVKVRPLSLPQDWREQYIHENYSRALEGEGLVEQVSPTQTLTLLAIAP